MLLRNQTNSNMYPVKLRGGALAMYRTMWGRSDRLNIFVSEGLTDRHAGIPSGYRVPAAWVLAVQDGGMSSHNEAQGSSGFSGAGALGLNGVASVSGVALVSAVGQLVLSAIATIAGQATVHASIVAVVSAAATVSGTSDVAAIASGLAWAIASIQGTSDVNAAPYSTGSMSASVAVGATTELTAAAVADEILDQQMVETGLTVRETLRLCAAALAGKVSISGNTVTIRNAVADDVDRIVATTTADGERTAVTTTLD